MADEVDIPIDDNVPMPEPVIRPFEGKYRKVVDNLQVGQSFVVYGEREAMRVSNAYRHLKKKVGKEFTRRKQEDGFYRIWRTK